MGEAGLFIPLARPDITEKDIEAVSTVLRSGMLVQGRNVIDLEDKFSSFCQVNHGVAASNGTATLHLALTALGIGVGDEVIVPAFSYVATANVVEICGAKPVFADIDLATYNIDPNHVEKLISPLTKAIIPVHEFGLACDILQICNIADRYGIPVIEDAACALGAKLNKKPVGSFGTLGSFSLHPRKSITCGEGGVMVTNNSQLAEKLKQFRNHGIKVNQNANQFVEAGFNYRLTDFQAALALSQFERLETILSHKNLMALVYQEEITNKSITLPTVPADRNHTWQTFHVLLDDSLDRDNVILRLREKGIGTNYGAQCIPDQHYYHTKYGYNVSVKWPNAYRAYRNGLAIPLYEKITQEQVRFIANTLNQL